MIHISIQSGVYTRNFVSQRGLAAWCNCITERLDIFVGPRDGAEHPSLTGAPIQAPLWRLTGHNGDNHVKLVPCAATCTAAKH